MLRGICLSSIRGIGTLEGTIAHVATVIETNEDGYINRRSVPNTKMLNEAVR